MKLKINFNLPLFWKFALAIIFVVLIFGSINAYLIFKDVQSSLERESQKRAMNIAHSLAAQSITPLLFEDYVQVQNLMDEARSLDSTVVYSFVIDKYYSFIAGSYDYQITFPLIAANKLSDTTDFNVLLMELKDPSGTTKIRDIALPILGGELGYIRVGISEEGITKDVYSAVSHFWFMVGFFLFVGILGALLFAMFITRPINSIQETADKISLENLAVLDDNKIEIRQKFLGVFPFLFRATDEIDLLTDKFNDMILRLKKAYSELEFAQKKLIESEKLASIGTLSAGIAHEINNPLAGIQNAIQRILDNPDNIKQNRKYLELINQAINRIEHVVKGLLSFARKEDFSYKFVSVNSLIDEVVLLLKSKMETNNITLIKNIEEGVEVIFCSPNHLEQVLLNLLMNSIDAIMEKGTEGEIRLTIKRKTPFILLAVEDNGIGIKPEILNQILDPFFTTKLKGKGTGLGLAVINNIIAAHNGKINISSGYGEWTKVEILIPEDDKCMVI